MRFPPGLDEPPARGPRPPVGRMMQLLVKLQPAVLHVSVSVSAGVVALAGEATAVVPTPAPSPVPEPAAALFAWLVFCLLLVSGVAAMPVLARLVGRALPERSRGRLTLPPVRFGDSQKTQRSPRHAVLLHRVLLSTLVTCVLAMLLIPGITALPSLGVEGLQVALALVVPGVFVMLHARRRGPRR